MPRTKLPVADKNGRPQVPETLQAPRRYASSTEVARLAGVSQSAVSRAFTPGASVSKITRGKILAAAEELGYQPNMLPKIILKKQSQLIGVVVGGLYNPYYASILEDFSMKLQALGKQILLYQVNHGEYIDEVVPLLMGYRVDALITALSILSDESAEACAKMQLPVVLFNGRQRNEWISSVCCDNVAGGRKIAALFMERGTRRYAYIAGKRANMANEDREAGYIGHLAERGIGDVRVAVGDFHYEGGYRAAIELFSPKIKPDAVFCANDLTAIGAIEAIRKEFGLRVPEDVMVAGFDDIPAASWPSYDLTTVRQEGERMVDEALRILDRKFSGEAAGGGILSLVPGTVVQRGTTRR